MTSNERGTLSWTEFVEQSSEFCTIATELRDNWTYKQIKEEPGYSYLEKRVSSLHHKGTVVPMETTKDVEDVEEPQDSCCLEPTMSVVDVITSSYHILYSPSYAVPVMYFNMFHSDGRLLTIEEVWREVPVEFQDELRANSWRAITQTEHPLLGVPYFSIHPCRTEGLMRTCLSNKDDSKRNYIIIWLSMFGPLVGLEVPLAYGRFIGR